MSETSRRHAPASRRGRAAPAFPPPDHPRRARPGAGAARRGARGGRRGVLRRHPLQRALRADKLTLAALEGTLVLYLGAAERIPVLRMVREDAEAVRARAERL